MTQQSSTSPSEAPVSGQRLATGGAASGVSAGIKIPIFEKVGYALGDTASNLFWKTFEFFLMFFYTDVFGVNAAAVGTMLLVTRIWDAVNDPMMGVIADRTKSRWGRFRPYVLFGGPALAAAAVLTFTTPDLDEGGKVVYAYITYTFLMMMYTLVNVPYSALMGVMTDSSQERTGLSSFRFIGAFAGGFFVNAVTLKLVKWLGQGNEQLGWQLTMAMYGLLASLMFTVTFFTTKERILPPVSQKPDLGKDLKDLATNVPWLVLFLLGMFVIVAFWMRGGSTMYYFKYYVGDEELAGSFLTWGAGATLAGTALTGLLSKFVGKKRLYQLLMATAAVLMIAFYFLKPENITAMFVLNTVTAFILAPTAPLVWAMYADTADYAEYRSGRRSTGLVFSAAMFGTKLGGALGGFMTGMTLTWFGYVANQDQTPDSIQGILLMMSWIPGLTCCVAAGIVALYTLSEDKMKEIEATLRSRRASAGTESA